MQIKNGKSIAIKMTTTSRKHIIVVIVWCFNPLFSLPRCYEVVFHPHAFPPLSNKGTAKSNQISMKQPKHISLVSFNFNAGRICVTKIEVGWRGSSAHCRFLQHPTTCVRCFLQLMVAAKETKRSEESGKNYECI